MLLTEINKNIVFDEPSHTYTLNGKKLISTTTLLGLYKNKFDPDGFIIRAVARRDGLTIEEVKEKWEKTKNEGCDRGTNFHRQAEHFIKTKEILDEDYQDVIKQLKDMNISGKLSSEIGLFSPTYSIAGTADLISEQEDGLMIFDFKSNKKFTVKSKYKKYLLYPLQHLQECDLTVYSLQLTIYSFMLKEHGYKIKDGSKILWINPETRLIEKYPILDLNKEVQDLLTHHKQITDF